MSWKFAEIFGQLEAINKQFLTDLMTYHKLYKNKKQYDALIMIISGIWKSCERDIISIDEIRTSFDCNRMKSFQDFPKIFIIACCLRGIIATTNINVGKKGEKVEEKIICIMIMDLLITKSFFNKENL
ncbi:hypothetical protein RFI_24878 [Reticulomyxa filosa]|uniref:Uncharacterized protein n=1 Tax=Reticulomyxa filosa TaxID=46433 RepID=X6MF43_RETFI|nr:hypothetical protein RFI_24878 [Reticulomyxa filosa]|eukprot:ETO12499.1 hypothetical protein RFI_24878 [Reticulomyxa filosa]